MNKYVINCYGCLANGATLEITINRRFNFKKYIENLNKINDINGFCAEVILNGKLLYKIKRTRRESKRGKRGWEYSYIFGYGSKGKFQAEKYYN